jgi:proto-oncogene tyrosine-protein kinase ROS
LKCLTVRKRQVQEQKKKSLEDNRLHRNGLELVPWPELPGHPHQVNTLYTNSNFDLDEELMAMNKIQREQISETQFLGRGAFGEVFEGKWLQMVNSEPKITKVAIKVSPKIM